MAETTLREQLAGSEPVLAPGAYDALSARLAEQAGFDAAARGTPVLDGALLFDEFTSLIGLPELQRLEERYTAT